MAAVRICILDVWQPADLALCEPRMVDMTAEAHGGLDSSMAPFRDLQRDIMSEFA